MLQNPSRKLRLHSKWWGDAHHVAAIHQTWLSHKVGHASYLPHKHQSLKLISPDLLVVSYYIHSSSHRPLFMSTLRPLNGPYCLSGKYLPFYCSFNIVYPNLIQNSWTNAWNVGANHAFRIKKTRQKFVGWFSRYQKIDVESTGVYLCINNLKFDHEQDHVIKCGIFHSILITQPISFGLVSSCRYTSWLRRSPFINEKLYSGRVWSCKYLFCCTSLHILPRYFPGAPIVI